MKLNSKNLKSVHIFLLAVSITFITQFNPISANEDITAISSKQPTDLKKIEPNLAPPFTPVYRINLRVHIAKSKKTPQQFLPIFKEINNIWWSQAAICFEIHTVFHDRPLNDGIDMWFSPYIGGFNGYYDGEQIQMTDDPILASAPNPAKFSTARTAAHELGHALDLGHKQDSDDNLMRSKTFGWQLSKDEIITSRSAAAHLAQEDTTLMNCSAPRHN